jgi:hypothetical protein
MDAWKKASMRYKVACTVFLDVTTLKAENSKIALNA